MFVISSFETVNLRLLPFFYISIKKRAAAPTKMQLPNSLKISAYAWFFYHAKDVRNDKIALKMFLLKVHKRENFFGSDFEFYTFL